MIYRSVSVIDWSRRSRFNARRNIFVPASSLVALHSRAAQNPPNSNGIIRSDWKLKTGWKIEYWLTDGPHLRLSKSRGRFHMVRSLLSSSSVGEHVHSFLWQASFQHQNWGVSSAEAPRASWWGQQKQDQKRKKKKERQKERSLGIFIWNVGECEKWKVDALLGAIQNNRLKTIFHSIFTSTVPFVIGLDIMAGRLGGWDVIWCILWSRVVRCILTDWIYCHTHFCKCYKSLHHIEIFSAMSNSHPHPNTPHTVVIVCVRKCLCYVTHGRCTLCIKYIAQLTQQITKSKHGHTTKL